MRFSGQSGQAMIELALMLLLMCFVTLGMILVCGMADYADEALISARFDAEKNSRDPNAFTVSGEEYTTWSSQSLTAPYKNMRIPFNLEERPAKGPGSIGNFGENLGDSVYSVPDMSTQYSEYKTLNKYHRTADFDQQFFKHDFYDTSISDNMFAGAELIKGSADISGNNTVSSVLSSSGHRKAVRNKSEAASSYSKLMGAFTKMFGVNIYNAADKIKSAPSSEVYMPKATMTTE